ncbi:MAG: glycosyl hydrolase [Actinomycetota bacterium]
MRGSTRFPVAAVVLALTVSAFPVTEESPDPDPEPPSAGIVFGTSVSAGPNETTEESVLKTEAKLGRKLAAVRVYEKWDSPFPSRSHTWLRDTDHAMYLSVKAQRRNGTMIPWRNIAAAQPGDQLYSEMQSWGRRFRDFGDTIYFVFNHEPEAEASRALGTSTDFKDAWRKVHEVFDSVGATNVEYVWVMTSWAFRTSKSDPRFAKKWYPGSAYVDEIGADPYNWFDCRDTSYPWRSAEFALESIRQFGLKHPHKDLMLAEYGTVEDRSDPGRKADWIRDMSELMKQPEWGQFKTLLYYHSVGQNEPDCVWKFDTSQAAANALAEMGSDPHYRLAA